MESEVSLSVIRHINLAGISDQIGQVVVGFKNSAEVNSVRSFLNIFLSCSAQVTPQCPWMKFAQLHLWLWSGVKAFL